MSPATRLPRPRPPVGQSMALLTDLMEHPLERSYQDRAEARIAQGAPGASGMRSPLLLISCVALGLILVLAAQTLRVPEERASGERAELVSQIEDRQKSNRAAEDKAGRLRSEVERLRTAAGAPGDDALQAGTQVTAGTVAVTGPGLVLTLDDQNSAEQREGTDPREGQAAQQVLTAHDMQIVVNGLWQAGAEAISINGYRLTALSAIRFAGEAILVDFRPIARPYVVTAIGDGGDLWTTFRDRSSGAYLEGIKAAIDLDVAVDTEGEVTVPATDTVALREARPVGSPGTSPTREGNE